MRKLLEEAAKVLTDARFNAMQGPLSEGQKAMIDGWAELRSRITAALSAPEPNAMELVDQLAAIINSPFDTAENRKQKASQLIELFIERVGLECAERAVGCYHKLVSWEDRNGSDDDAFIAAVSTRGNAAALIESHSKRVPRAMLSRIVSYVASMMDWNGEVDDDLFIDEIAKEFGYRAE